MTNPNLAIDPTTHQITPDANLLLVSHLNDDDNDDLRHQIESYLFDHPETTVSGLEDLLKIIESLQYDQEKAIDQAYQDGYQDAYGDSDDDE